MIDKIDITKRLTRFFKRTNIESFFKIIIVICMIKLVIWKR